MYKETRKIQVFVFKNQYMQLATLCQQKWGNQQLQLLTDTLTVLNIKDEQNHKYTDKITKIQAKKRKDGQNHKYTDYITKIQVKPEKYGQFSPSSEDINVSFSIFRIISK